MTTLQLFLTIGIIALTTLLTRVLPFVVFHGDKEIPGIVSYFGKVLPPAALGMLVVYCLKDVIIFTASLISPELLAALMTAVMQVLFRRSMLSILLGTALYILLRYLM